MAMLKESRAIATMKKYRKRYPFSSSIWYAYYVTVSLGLAYLLSWLSIWFDCIFRWNLPVKNDLESTKLSSSLEVKEFSKSFTMTTVSDAASAHFLKQKSVLFFFDSPTMIRFRVLLLAAVSDKYDSIDLWRFLSWIVTRYPDRVVKKIASLTAYFSQPLASFKRNGRYTFFFVFFRLLEF